MRHEQQSLTLAREIAEFRFNFQMTYKGARHACTATVRAASREEANTLFRDNWSEIEKLAREGLTGSVVRDIRLQQT
jgi:hypothetical protein